MIFVLALKISPSELFFFIYHIHGRINKEQSFENIIDNLAGDCYDVWEQWRSHKAIYSISLLWERFFGIYGDNQKRRKTMKKYIQTESYIDQLQTLIILKNFMNERYEEEDFRLL